MSTYYALDITNPNAPGYLWEFTDNHLGYSTTGATIVRTGDPDSNGNWFAVFASGPTGPIDTTENKFLADSDQNLHIFVLDLMTGALIRDIDTGITNAFGGSMVNASLDVDRWRDKYNTEGSRYEDDVIYVGYNKKTTTGDWRGGVIRISPKTWTWSTVVDTTDDGNMGPVTAGVAKLVNPKIGSAALYLFFGTGRYNYKLSNGTVDDPVDKQYLYAVKEDSSCYNKDNGVFSFCASHGTILWSKQLAQDDGTYYAERCLTTPTANFNGNIILITYQPFRNVCSTGGATYAWILNYLTGSTSITSGGKYLIMLGGGLIENYETTTGGKNFITYTKGTTPIDPGTGIFFPKPLRKILHIKER
jgi:type IV pilus assembly protein PilY1